MPDNLFGLPTHVLVQHIVVVLLPIAAAAALLVALWAWYRHHHGIATLVATFLVTLFVPLTTQSGESLASRLPDSQVITAHAAAGDRVQWVAALFRTLPVRRRCSGSPASGGGHGGARARGGVVQSSGARELAGGSPRLDVAGPDGRAHPARRRRDRGARRRDPGRAFGRPGRVVRLPEPPAVASLQWGVRSVRQMSAQRRHLRALDEDRPPGPHPSSSFSSSSVALGIRISPGTLSVRSDSPSSPRRRRDRRGKKATRGWRTAPTIPTMRDQARWTMR
jgi:hypothetical protein